MAAPNDGRYNFTPPQYANPMVTVNAPINNPCAAPPSQHPPMTPQTYQTRPLPQQRAQYAPEMDVKPVITPQLPPDYSVLLLSLADEYIGAARKLVPLVAHGQDTVNFEKYYELVSAGLRCVECSLMHPNFRGRPPRQEALLQLKYAALLFEETVNYGTVEELLGKAIMLCDRHRFPDLKYSMHHLLVRVLSKTNVRTALKHADHIIPECETLQYIPWIYAFHFLRASLLIDLRTTRDTHTALTGLRRTTDLARQRNDAEIGIAASLMQCAIHLRIHKEDSISEAQRALAGARAQLSNYSTKDVPQLYVMAHQLDLAASLDPYEHTQAQSKLHAMQHLMDNLLSGIKWRRDRGFHLRLHTSGMESLVGETGGIFGHEEDRGLGLSFSWLGRIEAYAFAFLLSAIGSFQKSARDKKCEIYLKESLKSTGDDQVLQDAPQNVPLSVACEKASSLQQTRSVVFIQLAFAYCFRTDWKLARSALQRAQQLLPQDEASDAAIMVVSQYLQGVIQQGLGEFDAALATYNSANLTLDTHDTNSLSSTKMLAILATLNSLLIVHDRLHPRHNHVPEILEKLRCYFPTTQSDGSRTSCVTAQHSDLTSAFSFVMAVLEQSKQPSSQPGTNAATGGAKNIVASKQALQAALTAAQKACNPLLMTLCLSYMHHLFFVGIFDEQSAKIVQASGVQANEAGNQMWADIARTKHNQGKGQQRLRGWQQTQNY